MSFVRTTPIAVLMLSGLLSGCFTKPDTTYPTSADSYDGPHKTRPLVAEGDAKPTPAVASPTPVAATRPSEAIVYFDFDQSTITPEWRRLLTEHAKWLKANPNQKVVLEGHCDERGTREYNIALGERRANAVKRFLTVQGVSDSQLETVSFGEEKPAETASTEEAWAKNRRVELRYE